MSKKLYIGNNSLAVSVPKLYIGVGNSSKKILKGYVGVNGLAKQFYGIQYRWAKYNLNSSTKTSYQEDPESTDTVTKVATNQWTKSSVTSSYRFSTSTGQFTLSGSLSGGLTWYDSFSGYCNTVYQWRAQFQGCTASTSTTDTQIHWVSIPAESSSSCRWRIINRKSVTETVYSRGTYIEDVYADNQSAYPNNTHDGKYWYVYLGEA